MLRASDPVFAAAISGFAAIITGRYTNPTGDPAHFTTVYFHRPEQLAEEVTEARFRDIDVLALEGIAWAAGDLEERWADPQRRAVAEEFLRRLEREPSLMGASPHLLAVGRA